MIELAVVHHLDIEGGLLLRMPRVPDARNPIEHVRPTGVGTHHPDRRIGSRARRGVCVDERTQAWAAGEQPIVRQFVERLPHRGTADIIQLAPLLLGGDALPRLPYAALDLLSDQGLELMIYRDR